MTAPKKVRVQPPPESIEPQEWQNPKVTAPAPGHRAVHPEPQSEAPIPFNPIVVPPLAQEPLVIVEAPPYVPPEPPADQRPADLPFGLPWPPPPLVGR